MSKHKYLVWVLALGFGGLASSALGAEKASEAPKKLAPADKAAKPEAAEPKKASEPGAAANDAAKDNSSRTPEWDRLTKRDPFKSLLIKKEDRLVEAPEAAKRPSGIRGALIGEVKLIGVAKGLTGEKIAIVMSTDQKAHFMYPGDRVWDGFIQGIDDTSVLFIRELKSTAGAVRRQEVKLFLYPPIQQ